MLNTGLVGLVFAGLYAFSESLWWLMLAHALVDMNGGIAAFRMATRSCEVAQPSRLIETNHCCARLR